MKSFFARFYAPNNAALVVVGLTGEVNGGINAFLGGMFDVNGPTLWQFSLIHDADRT